MSWDFQPSTRTDVTQWDDSWPSSNTVPTRNPVIDDSPGVYSNYEVNGGEIGQEVNTTTDVPETHNGWEETRNSAQDEFGFSDTRNMSEHRGDQVAERPPRPPPVCRNCQETGHEAFACELPRKLNRDHIPDMPAEQAWNLVLQACQERDLDDLKEAVEIYVKACPDTTYQELEKSFRESSMEIYIIALEKELAPTYTNMDFQGNLDRTYSVTWRWSPKPMRPKEIPTWPKSPAENFERLGNAGEPTDRGIPRCNNCNTFGHVRKNCPEEVVENVDRPVVMCFNCQKVGHRIRDCVEPRQVRSNNKNGNQSEYNNEEYTEPEFSENY